MENSAPSKATIRDVGILGTGQYASAFANRLLTAGYCVTLGSRRPDHPHPFLFGDQEKLAIDDIRVTSLEDCVRGNDVIIVALHVDHFKSTFTPELGRLCRGKVLIDVSNRSSSDSGRNARTKPTSNAQLLASLVPEARVVKAFNSISAYVMENDVTAGGTRAVPVAGDDVMARATVCALARDMGFEPQENGSLANAWKMEEAVLRAFPEWTLATVVSLVMFVFWFLFAVSRFYLASSKMKWDQLPLKILNKVFGATSLTLLSLTYFPSTFAALFQVAYGTKYRRFPGWLDAWLKSRKQLGLLAYFLICFHAVISTLILSPTYMRSWFPANAGNIRIPVNVTENVVVSLEPSWMTWIGELSLLVGIVSFALMSLLAVTSLPSVARSLNWAEWRLIHSRLGYVMLTLAMTHVYVMGVPKWMKTGFPRVFFQVKFLSIVLPSVVIGSKLILLLPCVDGYVARIRKGWERSKPAGKQDLTGV